MSSVNAPSIGPSGAISQHSAARRIEHSNRAASDRQEAAINRVAEKIERVENAVRGDAERERERMIAMGQALARAMKSYSGGDPGHDDFRKHLERFIDGTQNLYGGRA